MKRLDRLVTKRFQPIQDGIPSVFDGFNLGLPDPTRTCEIRTIFVNGGILWLISGIKLQVQQTGRQPNQRKPVRSSCQSEKEPQNVPKMDLLRRIVDIFMDVLWIGMLWIVF